MAEKTRRALRVYMELNPSQPMIAVAGGVAANQAIRAALTTVAEEAGAGFTAPPLKLCTDNGAMIAYAGLERFALSETDDMTLQARPRWPLDKKSAPMIGSGKKGAKA